MYQTSFFFFVRTFNTIKLFLSTVTVHHIVPCSWRAHTHTGYGRKWASLSVHYRWIDVRDCRLRYSNRDDGHRGHPETLKWHHTTVSVTERTHIVVELLSTPGTRQDAASGVRAPRTKCFTLTTWDNRNHFVWCMWLGGNGYKSPQKREMVIWTDRCGPLVMCPGVQSDKLSFNLYPLSGLFGDRLLNWKTGTHT